MESLKGWHLIHKYFIPTELGNTTAFRKDKNNYVIANSVGYVSPSSDQLKLFSIIGYLLLEVVQHVQTLQSSVSMSADIHFHVLVCPLLWRPFCWNSLYRFSRHCFIVLCMWRTLQLSRKRFSTEKDIQQFLFDIIGLPYCSATFLPIRSKIFSRPKRHHQCNGRHWTHRPGPGVGHVAMCGMSS